MGFMRDQSLDGHPRCSRCAQIALVNSRFGFAALTRFLLLGYVVAVVCIVGCQRDGAEEEPPSVASAPVTKPHKVILSSDAMKRSASEALRRGDVASAEQWIRKALMIEPEDASLLELAGDHAVATRDLDAAVSFYQEAIDFSSIPSNTRLDKLGHTWMTLGRPYDALKVLESAVKFHPKDPAIRTNLAGLYASLGLQREAGPHLQWLVMRSHGGVNELVMLSDMTRPQNDKAIIEYAQQHYPDDLRPQFATARGEAYQANWKTVAELLEPVVEKYPEFQAAYAHYGRALAELGDEAAMAEWMASLPEQMEQQPQYWIAAGIWSENHGNIEQATRAYWQAALLDENNGEALNRLAAGLAELGMQKPSRVVAERAGQITSMRDTVDLLNPKQYNSQKITVQVAKQLHGLGRSWEAAAWLRAASRMTAERDPTLAEVYAEIRGGMSAKTPWQDPDSLIARKMDLGSLPKLDWNAQRSLASQSKGKQFHSMIRFSDQATDRGLNHTCEIGKADRGESGLWIYQSGGGASAAIDFDLDGWSDLYYTNQDGTPMQNDSLPNRLFRNRAGRFQEVTPWAGVGDTGYSQGVAVADVNSDGFPDLLAASIGRNRLFQNNGDGTFTDVTEEVGLRGSTWTTSVAFADIDQDGFVDLFEVGYCSGNDAITVPCLDKDDHLPYSCMPTSFPAQADRVWRGDSEGHFTEVTSDWLGKHEYGHGLGLVVGQLDEIPGIDVYVGNDMTANHFWSSTKSADSEFRLREQAVIRGLAVNRQSLSQASMGIAVGDPDADGDFDLFLTHFLGEYNTYYEQVSPGMWVDLSSRVGLADPSMDMLAFGTQWFDADNDGTLELMLANGHIDDYRKNGDAYRMPMHLFHRSTSGRWNRLDASSLGEYFSTERLGRSLINVDINRDGLVDASVTHLFDPVSLLINESETDNSSITLFLKSTSGQPDAIGATVTIEVAGKPLVAQLLGGNGYHGSNERCLRFGLGPSNEAKDVVVQWPSGKRELFGNLFGGDDYLIVEGSAEAFSLGRP
ncbi:CRTAC1 family protein [Novipirellula artificiosorum]|uniref:Tetratricopeptide repeat protein n=1 Tax=Novipirellula artificiosorum TaxID=2528016 RepID=A0A5C6E3M4_9BACT|nr:CRTAC1 family protein [Novipirellula artificiosorum]TWU42191.1 tetratricopeptide repeat protein [Novipirellula artificiosorum]